MAIGLLAVNMCVLTYALFVGIRDVLEKINKTEERLDVVAAGLIDLARGQIKTERDVRVLERWVN